MTAPTPEEQSAAVQKLDEVLNAPDAPAVEEKTIHPPLKVLDEGMHTFTVEELNSIRSRFEPCECVMPTESEGVPVPPPDDQICPPCVIRGLIGYIAYQKGSLDGMERVNGSLKKQTKTAHDLCTLAIAQRDLMTKRYEELQKQGRGYDDLQAAILRRLKDANLRKTAALVVQNERLKMEVQQLRLDLERAKAGPEKGEGTVPA